MSPPAAGLLRIVMSAFVTLLVALPALWGSLALWYQVPDGPVSKTLSIVLWAVFSVSMLIGSWHGRWSGLLAFGVAFAIMLMWWSRIAPSNDRLWADDVARMTTGTLDGHRVILHNVRNFDWHTENEYTQRWETRTYDLDHLRTVDMIMSYWAGPAIAHTLMSFGFDTGSHVVFSVEIRRQKSQAFSEVGGFFKEFELSILAADERDVIRVRTNVRGEDDYLYQVRMPLSAMRSLFLAYVDEANRLVDAPRFYNTITVNCTTLVYHMVTRIVGRLPVDYRLLLSGYLPQYVYGVGGLNHQYSLQELRAFGRISERARLSGPSADFSEDIRRGMPPIDLP